jgi:hypothetical protein
MENWLEIKPDTPCIVILNAVDDFVFKLVTVNKKDKSFLLRSLNPAYAPYTATADEILEMWKFKKLHLDEIPEPVTGEPEWKRLFSELKQEIRSLKR